MQIPNKKKPQIQRNRRCIQVAFRSNGGSMTDPVRPWVSCSQHQSRCGGRCRSITKGSAKDNAQKRRRNHSAPHSIIWILEALPLYFYWAACSPGHASSPQVQVFREVSRWYKNTQITTKVIWLDTVISSFGYKKLMKIPLIKEKKSRITS